MERQKKISRWLKCLCILITIMVIAFFAILSRIGAGRLWDTEGPAAGLKFFSFYTELLCFAVIWLFWKVCTEIGNDNSFSLENVANFHHMAYVGGALIVGYAARIIFMVVVGAAGAVPVIYSGVMICIGFVFTVICEALSQLIRNAYEMKQENDLTI